MKTAVELAYGLLWMVGCDRSTKRGEALYLARKALYEQLDRAGQGCGIEAARAALGAHHIPAHETGGHLPGVPQRAGMRDTMIRGMQAAFDEVAEYLEQQNAGGFAAHIRRRSVSLSRPHSESSQ